MIKALTGPNAYLAKRRLDELVGEFVKEYGELALERIDAEEHDLQVILNAVQAVPFLSERKMVVVRDLSLNPPAGGAAEAVEQIIGSTTETTYLIFYELVTDKRTIFYKALKAKTDIEEFAELDGRQLANWLVTEAKNEGGELPYANANFLVERVGANQQLLSSELQKLLIYDPKITHESIELLTEPAPQSKIFDLLDATFSGRKKRALELYAEQRAQKIEPQAILAMIGWQLRLLALAKHADGRTTTQISKETGVSTYPIDKARGLAGKLSDKDLADMVGEAMDIDIRGKTTDINLDEALKTYIVTL